MRHFTMEQSAIRSEEHPVGQGLPGGYAGNILRVDLTSGKTWSQPWTPEEMRLYVGGAGLGAKILWDEVPAHVAWDHPENRLILATGPLAGLPVWGTGGLSVVTRGAMTNGGTSTQANGFFGACLKYSGYDAIVIQGQSSRWVYLYIQDGVAELRDAASLVGKDTWETQDALHGELGLSGHQMSVYSIGPAGENLVRFAAIAGDYGHVASKNGCGAVMGKKRLKAVAIVRGTKALRVADPRGLFQAADEIAYELEDQSHDKVIVRVRHAQWCPESPQDRRPAYQELHDQRGPRGDRHGGLGSSQPAQGVRPSGSPVQRLRHAPLPHAGDPDRPPPGRDGGRAGVRGVGRGGLGHRLHRSRGDLVVEHPGGSGLRGRERIRLGHRLGDGVPGEEAISPRINWGDSRSAGGTSRPPPSSCR